MLSVFGTSFVVSVCLCLATPHLFKALGREGDRSAVQSAHHKQTLRLGGLALTIGLLVGVIQMPLDGNIVGWVLLLSLPLFVVGMCEDLGIHMAPRQRLISIALSLLLAMFMLGITVDRIGFPGFDLLLTFAPFAILFTLFGATGVVNAFNLIDGLNGLASFVGLSTAGVLGYISISYGQMDLAILCGTLCSAILGFFVVNYPSGRLFLGDAGAYLLGFLLICAALILFNREAGISAFAIVLIFFWPIADTCLAIWRRHRASSRHDQPDRLHYHQLVMRFLEIRWLGRDARHLSNPIATIILMPMIVAPQYVGVAVIAENDKAMANVALFSVLFFGSYIFFMNLAKISRLVHRRKISKTTRDQIAAE